MKKFLVIFLVVVVQACSGGEAPEGAKPRVAATIFPIYDIARNVMGDRLDVVVILPPGASPHTYEPSPRQLRELEDVALVFSAGHGVDDWTTVLIDTLPKAQKIVVDAGINLIESSSAADGDGHERGGAHHDEGANPHYWLSVTNAKLIARAIAVEAARLDAAGAGEYEANLKKYLAKLDAARERIEKRMNGLPTKKMMTFHGAWAYYADEFGLEIVGTFEPFPGKLPTPRYLARLYDEAKRLGVKSLFTEPQFSSGAAASFASDMGLELYALDPIGGVAGRESYIDLMEYNSEIIERALSNERR